MKIILTLFVFSIIIAAFLLGGEIFQGSSDNLDSSKIVVGVIAPISGGTASMGSSIRETLELEDIPGLTFQFEDDQCNPQKALTAYRALKLRGVRVFYMACSGSVLALAPLVKRNGGLILTAYAGSSEIRKTGTEVIRFVPDAHSISGVMEDYVKKRKSVSYGILHEEQEYASSVADLLSDIPGKELKGRWRYPASATSFKSELLQIKKSDLDLLILVPVSDAAARVLYKEMQDLRIDKFIVGDVNLCDYAFQPSDYGLKGVCPQAEHSSRGYYAFLEKFKDKYGSAPEYPFYDALTYDSMQVFSGVLGKLGQTKKNLDLGPVKEIILQGRQGVVSEYSFSENGEVVGVEYLKIREFTPDS